MQKLWSLPGIILLVGLFFLIKKLRQNETDPDWVRIGRLLRTEFFTLEKAVDSLRVMHDGFHGRKMGGDSTAFKIVEGPGGLPMMEWAKFSALFKKVSGQRKTVISAVSGVGLTTLGDRLGRLIASGGANFMVVTCAPQFDLEFHKKYIGETIDGQWRDGELLLFWEKARARPAERFVLFLDNIDKINPETFFGPELWEKLTDSKHPTEFGGREVDIPKNFWLVSASHLGTAAKIELSDEHFKRLGNQEVLSPSCEDLVIYLQSKRAELEQAQALYPASLDGDDRSKLAALRDTANLQRFAYFFEKTNQALAEKLDESYQLGWTNVRKLYRPEDFGQLRRQFITNANGLKPREPFTEKDLENIDYALKTGGLLCDSNLFSKIVDWLRDMGFLTEFTVVAMTAAAAAGSGWWFFRSNTRRLGELNERVAEVMQDFDNQQVATAEAHERLAEIKRDLHQKVAERKINHTAGLYFLKQIDDEARRLEIAMQTHSAFLQLTETFLEDGVLSEGEYKKLIQFLEAIRLKIPAVEWQRYRDEVEGLHQKFKEIG